MLQHKRRFNVEYRRASHAGLHYFYEFFRFDSPGGNQSERLSECLDLERIEKVHCELDRLAGAIGTKQEEFFAHGIKRGLHSLIHGLVSADHEYEFALFSAPSPACDGRVQEIDAAIFAGSSKFSSKFRRHGTRIDEHASFS